MIRAVAHAIAHAATVLPYLPTLPIRHVRQKLRLAKATLRPEIAASLQRSIATLTKLAAENPDGALLIEDQIAAYRPPPVPPTPFPVHPPRVIRRAAAVAYALALGDDPGQK